MTPVFQHHAVLILVAGLLAACAGQPPAPAGGQAGQPAAYQPTPDEHYVVRRGDSLYAIAFKFGLDWREIARLNGITAPYTIYPDQVLRLYPPSNRTDGATAGSPASSQPAASSAVEITAAPAPSGSTSRPLDTPRSSTTRDYNPPASSPGSTTNPTAPPAVPAASTGSSGSKVVGTQAPAGSVYSTPAGDPDRWIWPTQGRLISSFRANDPARKGIDIGGTEGQAVIASAAGQVVYSGSGMLGYGELIIIKHSDRILSAYAHNSTRLVSEGQQLTAGSKIAEMGTNDRNQALLHFEIRVNGVPQDPLKYLPGR